MSPSAWLLYFKKQLLKEVSNSELLPPTEDPPRILAQLPLELTWIEGNRQELICNGDGKRKTGVTWHKDGSDIKSGQRRAKLECTPVTYKDEGSYTCVAKNSGGMKEKQMRVNVLCE